MDLSINQRLKDFLESEQITQTAFSKTINVPRKQQVSSWINSREKIPDKVLIDIIIKFENLNHRWFLLGEGKMNNISAVIDPTKESYNKKIHDLYQTMNHLEQTMKEAKATMKTLMIDPD